MEGDSFEWRTRLLRVQDAWGGNQEAHQLIQACLRQPLWLHEKHNREGPHLKLICAASRAGESANESLLVVKETRN